MRLLSDPARHMAVAYYAGLSSSSPFRGQRLPDGFPTPSWGSVEYVEAVAAFQASHGLFVDGQIGARTLAVLYQEQHKAPATSENYLLYGNARIFLPESVQVVHAMDAGGYNFERAIPGTHVHGKFAGGAPRGIVLHDSVTTTAAACFRVLCERLNRKGQNFGLGTGLMLAPTGVVYQAVPDLSQVTYHATGWSTRFIGLDVVALLDPTLAPSSSLRRPPTSWAPGGFLDYTDEQKRVLPLICEAIATAIGFPYEWKRHLDGSPWTCKASEHLDLDPEGYRGLVAHAQISSDRWDGNRALEVLAAAEPSRVG